ncbi:hypothetical protein BH18ACT12_BH18ACT12_09740 [soil metagenome]
MRASEREVQVKARKNLIASVLGVVAAAFALAAYGGDKSSKLPQGSEPVELNPTDFSINIDNRYWPMNPGSRWVYSETDTTTNPGSRCPPNPSRG